MRGLGLKAEHHFVCAVHPDYAPLPEMTRDPEKAKQLLAEAGYPDGIDIEFNCKRDPAWELATVQAVTEQWAEAGEVLRQYRSQLVRRRRHDIRRGVRSLPHADEPPSQ